VALRNESVKPFRARGGTRDSVPETTAKCKRIDAQGCMERSKALYDGQNMHMIEKQLRLQTVAPFGQA
jgi:hypothetical protein